MVLNNQTAVLKVVDNIVYFTIKADTNTNANVLDDHVHHDAERGAGRAHHEPDAADQRQRRRDPERAPDGDGIIGSCRTRIPSLRGTIPRTSIRASSR